MQNKSKIIVAIIITFILTLSISVTAALVTSANNITFSSDKTDKTNVKESLDELYNMAEGNTYGIKREITTDSSAWERIGFSKGLEANAQIGTTEVKNDFDYIYPWSNIKTYNYDTGTNSITAWYGDSNFTFTPSGNIEVLTYIPEFYYKRYQVNGYEYILISGYEQEGFLKSEAFSIGRYPMSGDATRVHSRSGVAPLTYITITNARTYAQNIGTGFQQLDYHYFIIQLLYLVEYADYNSQAKLGLGYTSNYDKEIIISGGCNSLGMKSGTLANDWNHSVIYRGIEDIYGNVWQYVDGINIKDNQVYINYNPATYETSKFDGDYKPISYVSYGSDGYDKYISKLGYDVNNPLMTFPIETTGTESTGITDIYWPRVNGASVVSVGGHWGNGTQGLWNFAWDNTQVEFQDQHTGARLLKNN